MLTRGMAANLSYVLASAPPVAGSARASSSVAAPATAGLAGEGASAVADIAQVLFVGAAAIFVMVAALVALAMFGPAPLRRRLASPALIVGAGIAFPVIALTALLVYVLGAGSSLARAGAAATVRIEVTGELWWWRVRYLDASGAVLFETANDIRIPVGEWVQFDLKSDNVIHSFWIPELAGKLDMIPGRVNRMRVRAQTAGTFTGQCAEYCGAQHANMKFNVAAITTDAFQAWQAAQARPAMPAGPSLRRGEQRFQQDCAQCHTVRGTPASGAHGPDLTHVGSRLSLAAGTLPNNVGALAGWIAGSQHIKPGNAMPSFNHLSGEDLRALASYLESLK
ncbi:Cytochrome c oxidase subunit 2 [Achromobacter piechaudii]|uniref:Cytochrome c oxidase subunit 2 n=2 Tax=Achromobacter piechaudii TaxID=72556 RepID=A0ABN7EY89_9BURK|nr:Cytochrome c oxidase subunit 2 [Achromobacter piechaudii]CAB3868095.1 Cytochrome c oxidase subunit 2 [Achromobacter piechaudii]CAB3948467.1 Cytochrome c oxidase subunit 2 [Achromobacter piechaudii]